MSNFNQNNLAYSLSPYLQQHKNNPVHWQEWNEETLNFAQESSKLIFVSIGYATCHWCHVMASEAFSDQETADYLNENFVSIKIDREQRPDIDEYFMNFVTRSTGQGGWPLNVVISPDGKPFFGGTYFPHKPKHGLLPLKEVLKDAQKWYEEHKNDLQEYTVKHEEEFLEKVEDTAIAQNMRRFFDEEFGGFGTQTKFPPHNTLLFLLNFYQETKSESAQEMILETLDAMANKGLHDHLQGGFYRYCVDREWVIPHFEKMLYDQAMLLWVYSLSFQLFKRDLDKVIAEKIVKNLSETFSDGDGLFYSAHDADTNHEEGGSYTWSEEELRNALSNDEFNQLSEVYRISKNGNFEGKNHLVKKEWKLKTDVEVEEHTSKLNEIETKLLSARKKRIQPFVDKKIVTSWNALTGIGLLMASRYLGSDEYKSMAFKVFDEIVKRHFAKEKLAHSSLEGTPQRQEFLEDYASVLLLATYLYEDVKDDREGKNYKAHIEEFLKKVNQFKIGNKNGVKWFGNIAAGDFRQIPANTFDHPTPSAVSLAEMAIFRVHKILEKDDLDLDYKALIQNDFHNLVAYYTKGRFHEIHSPERFAWSELPINSLFKNDKKYQDCTAFMCNEFKSKNELIDSFALEATKERSRVQS